MKKSVEKIFLVLALLCGMVLIPAWAVEPVSDQDAPNSNELVQDTSKPRYQTNKIYPETQSDLEESAPIDLPNPENIKTKIDYDPTTSKFFFNTQVGEENISTPFYLNSDEYSDYTAKKSLELYYLSKNRDEKKSKYQLSLTEMKFDIGQADKVFGPGGVQLKLQGSAELDFGLDFKKLKDPSLNERSQNPAPTFDFDEKIQLSVDGSVGDKLKFGLNYNTEATFDFDQSLLKLQYEGKEDDIIKKIEAGNVSMPLTGSLITGNTSLFGFKADLQFGKLKINAVISQQESEGKTLNTSGAQTTDYEIRADAYDENRHYFLSHYFREHYDEWMSDLPNISSGVSIGEIEVWVTNKNTINYDNTANVVGFADIAEPNRIYNPSFISTGNPTVPDNAANTLFADVVQSIGGLPSIYEIDTYLHTFSMQSTIDYVKLEGARKLESSEYTINRELGYISLKSALNNDEMLAVAYQYTYKGKVYNVGELSKGSEPTKPLSLKLLKSIDKSPFVPTWDLMMKNVYALGAYQVQKDKFTFNIMYRNDSTGIDLRYISEGPIAKKPLIKVMNLDRLDSHLQKTTNGDGIFDYVEGYTIVSQNGRVIFPVLEPFGSYLKKALNNDPVLIKKYVFQELYDSTMTVAQELAEKNKFYMVGEYRASSGSEIRLNAMNVPKGSVKVTAGGRELVENVDYTVDYMMGVVSIMNQDLIDLGTPISVTMESQSMFNMKRKSLIGTHLDYAFNDHFNVGGTIMYLSEKPLTEKVSYGDDPVANTIWGLNTSYRNQFQSVTDFLNKIPILNLKQPSTIAFNAEFAQMVPGTAKGANGKVYVDDFESTKIGFDVRYASNWKLSSTPLRFDESANDNNIEYGKNRALLSWYYIDNIFNRSTSSTPSYIRNDKEQLSNHFVREISEQEIFPNRELVYGQSTYIQTLDLAYSPQERGPYNVFEQNFNSEGYLIDPKSKWGGMMRKLETTDFEANNIEYLEFWMIDPFVYNDGTAKGGDLYFDFGDISEDILKDGRKFYENGMPFDGSTGDVVETVWGKVPSKQSLTYSFDSDAAARKRQDTGLDGLLTEEEFTFVTYKEFVDKMTAKLSPDAIARLQADKSSMLNDPAGDNFHHYRGTDYDEAEISILDRYKHYNGTEGNSPASTADESYTTASTNNPDIEDINQDNTMSETEKYYEYKISLRPEDMTIGNNYISDIVTSSVSLKNGETASVKWYQFKVPLRDSEKYSAKGGIRSFKSIRYMRMYLTDFEEPVNLRFATMELVKGEWRSYTNPIEETYYNNNGVIEMSSVSIEENSAKTPVNYVLPPGVSREVDPSQQQVRQENEQSMTMRVLNLQPKDSRALYKKLGGYDMRQYGRIQMFVHAEAIAEDNTDLQDNDLKLFVRMGSDYKNNYYEYEVPLEVTPAGMYSNNSTADREIVWPEDNMVDFPLSLLTDLKLARNEEKNRQGSHVTNLTPYSEVDPDKPNNKITIKGNPSLGEVEVLMIGIRNGSRIVKSGEIWVDELLLTDFDENGGVAALASLDIALSDFITLSAAGRLETIGFGGIEQRVSERRQDDYYQYNVNTGIDLGKLFPEKANVLLPIRFSYSNEITNPKYNPLDKDILLSDALRTASSKAMRDSILQIAQNVSTNRSLSIPNIRVGIVSKKGPRPWDPANFTIGGSYSETSSHNPNTVRNVDQYCNAYGTYEFSWTPKPWEPFGKISKLKNSKNWKWVADIGINYAPKRFAYKTNFARNYYEQLVRDFNNESSEVMDPTFQKDFMWNNDFDIAWDITKNIRLTLTTSNQSRISENEGGVNKWLYPDEYEIWKDSVRSSLAHLGSPMNYNQRFTASWSIPFNKIPLLNWISGNMKYDGSYEWLYGNETIANTATSTGVWAVDGKINFETLYNKSNYLKEVNKKFGSSRASSKNKSKDKTKKFEQTIKFSKGDTVLIKHKLNSKNVDVIASLNGKKYPIKYKVVDLNTISFIAKNNAEINLSVAMPDGDKPVNMALDITSRILMLVRNVSFNYSQTDGTILPGFKPSVTCLGLNSYDGKIAPGWDFVFGVQNSDMLDRAINNNWLVMDDVIFNPAVMSHSETFKASALLEPFPGFKINLAADRQYVNNRSVEYGTDNRLTTLAGSLSMSYVAIGTSFASMTKSGSYSSELFDQFLEYRNTVRSRLNSKYNPSSSYGLNTDDVLIPAFLAAYSGRDPNKVSLSSIPSFWSFLPNWQITFDGLSRIPWIKEHFRSVNLTHAYNCKYQMGSFTADQSFMSIDGDDFGYVTDVLSGGLTPSSRYTVGSVSINEQFSPLIGVDINMKNSLSLKVEWRKGRNLGLNLSGNQVVESWNDEYVVGLGYKFSDLNFTMKSASKQKKVKNDLTLRADFSLKDTETLVRKIELEESQATAGDKVIAFKFAADYVFSERINFRLYYDLQMRNPVITTSYPTTISDVGIAVKILLTR
ncbi:MAG: cell surface protein SprA [Bacteroidia bacterium]|nr:cell surface protein SprA [Bacteroidia bacterium]